MGFLPLFLNRSLISFVQASNTQANLISSKNQETIRGQSGFSFLNHFLNHTFWISLIEIYPGNKRVTKRALYKPMINIHS